MCNLCLISGTNQKLLLGELSKCKCGLSILSSMVNLQNGLASMWDGIAHGRHVWEHLGEKQYDDFPSNWSGEMHSG